MTAKRVNPDKPQPKRRPRATTLEARQNQLVALAVDVAEEQMRNGEASSQVITHFLKLGTVREQKEMAKIELETRLLEAKIDSIESAQRIESLYEEAIAAMRAYGGHSEPPRAYDD